MAKDDSRFIFVIFLSGYLISCMKSWVLETPESRPTLTQLLGLNYTYLLNHKSWKHLGR